jgi:hypothetical protein
MNQDVFGNPTDTSGALAVFSYEDMYTSYLTNAEPLLRSVPSYSVSSICSYRILCQTIFLTPFLSTTCLNLQAKVIKSSPSTPLPAGNPINGFQKNIVDPHGLEGGEAGVMSFRGDPSSPAMAGMYPPPAATLQIPIVIAFFNNSVGVNVGHFNNVSMSKESMSSDTTLLQMAADGMSLKDANMGVTVYSTSEVSTRHCPDSQLISSHAFLRYSFCLILPSASGR